MCRSGCSSGCPPGFAQTPSTPAPAAPPASSPAATPVAVPATSKAPLSITVLEGNNVINSISLLRSIAAVIEVRDANDFPVEDAAVTFTLPAQGAGGTFALGGKTFSTRTDARGQASAPLIVPAGAGKFQIDVTATAGDRKGEGFVTQTNSTGAYVGPPLPAPSWYKKKLVWVVAGGLVAGIVAIILLKHNSSSTPTVVVTPGTPVFQ